MKRTIQKIALATCLVAFGLTAKAQFSGGNGTVGNPYQIANKADLDTLSSNSAYWGDHFIQTADIMLTSADYTGTGIFNNSGAGFSPIGNFATQFTGSYDGQGHIIDSLYINRSSQNYVGLFSYTYGASLQNIGLTNDSIKGNYEVGGLVGVNYSSSTISNSYATGTVSGISQVGGLVGYNYSSTISNSYATAAISGPSGLSGGLVGYNSLSTISNSYAIGAVSGGSYIGGLVGYNYSSTTSNSFWNIDSTTTGIGTGPVPGAYGRNTAAMQNDTTYLNHTWDFVGETANGTNDYWVMGNTCGVNNNGYPILSWQVTSPNLPGGASINNNVTNVTCLSSNNGAINLSVSGGNGPFTYAWSNGDSVANITNLNSGSYSVAIIDANGCMTRRTDTIAANDSLSVSITSQTIASCGGNNGSATATAAKGTAPYTYSWLQSNESTAIATHLSLGNNGVTVADANGCMAQASALILDSCSNNSNYLSFDGVDDHVVIDSGEVNLADSSFTIEFWAKHRTNNANNFILGLGLSSANTNRSLHIGFRPSNVFTFAFWGDDLNTTTTFTDSLWHHYALTYNATTKERKIYVDGVLNTQNVATSNFLGTGEMWIGALPFSAGHLNGGVSNLSIWYGARTLAQIKATACGIANPTSEPNLIAYYKFDNGMAGGNNANDTLLTDYSAHHYIDTLKNFALTGSTSNWGRANINVAVANISHTIAECAGDSSGEMHVYVAGGAAPYTYAWLPGGGTSADTTGLPGGTYKITVTDALGCMAVDSAKIIANPLPTASITVDNDTVCLNGTSPIVTLTGANGTTPYSFMYNVTVNGNPLFSTTDTTSGTNDTIQITVPTNNANPYELHLTKVSDATCSQTLTDSVAVTVAPLPTVDAGLDVAICLGESDTLAASGLNGQYYWNGSSTDDSTTTVSPTANTTYGVIGTNVYGCSDTDSVSVTVNPLPTASITVDNDTVCLNGTSPIVTLTGANGTTPYSFMYNVTVNGNPLFSTTDTTSGTNDTIQITVPTNNANPYEIHLTKVSDSNGCSQTLTDSVAVTINPLPNINAGLDTSVCLGSSRTLVASGAGAGGSYLWNGTVNNDSTTVTPTVNTTYGVIGTDANGCSDTDSVSVTVNPLPTVNAGTDTAICVGTSITLSATGTATGYSWNNGVTDGVAFMPSATNTYQAIGVDSVTGCSDSDQVVVTVNTVDVSVTNNSPTLTADAGPATYQWLDCSGMTAISGATSQSYTATANGNYAVQITQNGCVDTSSCVAIAGLGIIKNNIATLQIFPNPTTENLTITTGKTYDELNIIVTDITGRVIETKQVSGTQKVQIAIKGAKGIYFIHITNKAGKTSVAKVIKD